VGHLKVRLRTELSRTILLKWALHECSVQSEKLPRCKRCNQCGRNRKKAVEHCMTWLKWHNR